MAAQTDSDSKTISRHKGPARDFADFCEAERKHRQNCDADFDAQLYDEAVNLVVRRLPSHRSEEGQQ